MISVHLILIAVDSGGFRLIPVFRRTRAVQVDFRQNIVLSIRQLIDSCSVSVGVGTPLIARLG